MYTCRYCKHEFSGARGRGPYITSNKCGSNTSEKLDELFEDTLPQNKDGDRYSDIAYSAEEAMEGAGDSEAMEEARDVGKDSPCAPSA